MQKKLIALAIAGLASSAAFAQSNVTVYGLVDLAYEHASGTNAAGTGVKLSGINSGAMAGSRLGFKGEEGLGNGMKAVFNLEYGITPDANSGVGAPAYGGTRSRVSYVGLAGNFGTVTLGRLYTPASDMAQKFDTLGGVNFASISQAFANFNTLNGNSALGEGSSSNTVKYTSNAMNGFTFGASYGKNDVTGADTTAIASGTSQQSTWSLGVDYTKGPLAVAYAYQRSNNIAAGGGATAGNGHDTTENLLGVTYDFGAVSVAGLYETQKEKDMGVGIRNADFRVWSLGLNVPITKSDAFHIAYARLNDKVVANDDSAGWGMYFDHDMSKRTKLYAGYARMSNDSGAARTVPTGAGNTTGGFALSTALKPGTSSNGYAMGILHSF